MNPCRLQRSCCSSRCLPRRRTRRRRWSNAKIRQSSFVRNPDRRLHAPDPEQGLPTAENLAIAHNNRGNAYNNHGDRERALPDFDQAVRLAPQSCRRLVQPRDASIRPRPLRSLDPGFQRGDPAQPRRCRAPTGPAATPIAGSATKSTPSPIMTWSIRLRPHDAEPCSIAAMPGAPSGILPVRSRDFDAAIRLAPQSAEAHKNRAYAYVELDLRARHGRFRRRRSD